MNSFQNHSPVCLGAFQEVQYLCHLGSTRLQAPCKMVTHAQKKMIFEGVNMQEKIAAVLLLTIFANKR